MENESKKKSGFRARFYEQLVSDEGPKVRPPRPDWILIAWLNEKQPSIQMAVSEHGIHRRDVEELIHWVVPTFHVLPASFRGDWGMIEDSLNVFWGTKMNANVYELTAHGMKFQATVGMIDVPIEADLVKYWPAVIQLTFVEADDLQRADRLPPEDQTTLWWSVLNQIGEVT